MLAQAVVGIAVVVATAVAIAIAKLVLVIAERKLRFGADVVDVRGSIGRVGWRKVRVRVRRTRSMYRRYLKRPWRSKWVRVDFVCRSEGSLKRFEMAGTLSRPDSIAKVGQIARCVCSKHEYSYDIITFEIGHSVKRLLWTG